MSRWSLKPGDLLMVDPVLPNIQAAPALVADNGVDLMWQFNPRPWHQQTIGGVQGLTAQEAEEVLRHEREFPWLLYKVWDDEAQLPYPIPESVQAEIERRQEAVASGKPAEVQGKIEAKPVDFDTPQGGLW